MPPAKKKTAKPVATGNLFAIIGTDEGRVKEEALRLCRERSDEGSADFANEIIEGTADNSADAARILNQTIQALQTLPFFGLKVVWLKNTNVFADTVTGRAAATLEGAEALADVLAQGLPEQITFILSASELDKRRSFYKQLGKVAKITIYDKPDLSKDGWEQVAMQLARDHAAELGLRFEPEALEVFVMLAGADSRQIANELEKIDLFLGKDAREVNADLVKRMVSQSREGVVFELGNALEQRDLPYAFELIDQLLYRGESAIGILLAAIVPRVRNLLQAKDLQERCGIRASYYNDFSAALSRLPKSDTGHLPVTKEGKPNAYPIFLAMKAARNFTLAGLRDALNECLAANRALVTTQLDPKMVLNRLVVKIAGRR